jgi:hypothetical protein
LRTIGVEIARSRSVPEVIESNSLKSFCFGYTWSVGSAHPTVLLDYLMEQEAEITGEDDDIWSRKSREEQYRCIDNDYYMKREL